MNEKPSSDSNPRKALKSGADVLDYLRTRREFFSEEALDAMDIAGQGDTPPTNPWEE